MQGIDSDFAECEYCGQSLTPAHKIKEVPIPNNPQFVAVALRCRACGGITKMIADAEVWEEREEKQNDKVAYFKSVLKEWDAAWEEVEGPEWLYEAWSKSPPPREETRGRCQCKECMSRWYVQN